MISNILKFFVLKTSNIFATIRAGDLEGLKLLLQKKPELINKLDRGESILHKAAAFGFINICKYLVEDKKMPVDTDPGGIGATPLFTATAFNNIDVMNYLIRKGADINHQDKDGVSCLHYAVARKLLEAATLLIKNKADLNLKDRIGRTPLDVARELKLDEMIGILD